MDFTSDIAAAAQKQNIPVDLFKNVIDFQSGGDQFFVQTGGGFGLSGLQPEQLQGAGFNPFDAKENIAGGAAVLRGLFDKFGNWKDATAAFVNDEAGAANILSNSNTGSIEQGLTPSPVKELTAKTGVPIVDITNDVLSGDIFTRNIVNIMGITGVVALVAFAAFSASKR